MFQEIIYDLLFGVRVQTSDIEGDQFELLPVRSHIGESSVDVLFVPVGECISPILSVTGSTPITKHLFVLGLLTLLRWRLVVLLLFLFELSLIHI